MGETINSKPVLEVSVSFGRFESDSLSWERWSSFSPNKYLEEVEKCATPGSVAQKKAYFEAHYKKIAARKAEQLDQKQMEHESLRSEDENCGDLIEKNCVADSGFNLSDGQTSADGVAEETKLDTDHLGNDHVDVPNEDATIDIETQDLLEAHELMVEEVREELCDGLNSNISDKPEEVALVNGEETPAMGSDDTKELLKNLENESKSIPIIKEENVRSGNQKESQKITPMSKDKGATRVKKKLESSVAKVPQSWTPKASKPVSTSITVSASRSSARKVTGSSLPRSKNTYVGENKKVAPKSLHMSLSLEPKNSDLVATTLRKSFIMDKMRDKDIVKGAFKTFQNKFDQLKSSSGERSLGAKQAPTKETEVKVSTSVTPRKENAVSLKTGGMDKKSAKAALSCFSLKSEERAEKRKESTKKLEEKSNAKDAESTRLQTKSKNEKEADNRKLRQSPHFKATPLPSFYHGQKVSKMPPDKVGSNFKDT